MKQCPSRLRHVLVFAAFVNHVLQLQAVKQIQIFPIDFVGEFVEWVRLEATAANESDIKHLETPLLEADLPKGIPVFADKGYDSAENREVLKCI